MDIIKSNSKLALNILVGKCANCIGVPKTALRETMIQQEGGGVSFKNNILDDYIFHPVTAKKINLNDLLYPDKWIECDIFHQMQNIPEYEYMFLCAKGITWIVSKEREYTNTTGGIIISANSYWYTIQPIELWLKESIGELLGCLSFEYYNAFKR